MWKVIGIFLHDISKHNAFIDKTVRPLMISYLQPKKIHNFILRGWVHGPHIAWHIDFTGVRNAEGLTADILAELQNSIQSYRSDEEMTDTQMKDIFKNLQIFELLHESPFPIYGDLTVTFSDSKLRNDIWGARGVEVIRDYYAGTGNLLLDLLFRTTLNKFEKALLLMHAAIQACGDPDRQQLSYRSHSEAFLMRFDRSGVIRSQFETVFLKNKSEMDSFLLHKLPQDIDYRKWCEYLEAFRLKTIPELESGELEVPEIETFENIIKNNGWATGEPMEMGEFHKFTYAIPEYQEVRISTAFKSKRLILNAIYLSISQLGIKPTEKFMMCYSLARWFELKNGVDWKGHLKKLYPTANEVL